MLYTMGIYNYSEDEFYSTILDYSISLIIDVRQRRGCRGRKYAYSNKTRLINGLKERGVSYLYIEGLAPTSDIRKIQKEYDKQHKQLKSQRNSLVAEFSDMYNEQVLEGYKFEEILDVIKDNRNKAIICVEKNFQGCHRSLIASYLKEKYGVNHTNL